MKQKPSLVRKISRVVLIIVGALALFTGILILPITQTFIGQRITENLTNRFGTIISVDEINISPLGYVTLENALAFDHHQDTLIHVGYARMNALRLRKVLQGENKLGYVMLRDVSANILTYRNENESNINLFFNRFKQEGKKNETTSPLTISKINLINGNLTIRNQNNLNRVPILFSTIDADIYNFVIDNKVISAEIEQLSTDTNLHNSRLNHVSGNYYYSPTEMNLIDASVVTASSNADFDINMSYPEKGLKDFSELVQLDVRIKKSELKKSEFGKLFNALPANTLSCKGEISGTLQNLQVRDAALSTGKTTLNFSLSTQNMLDASLGEYSGAWTLNSTETSAFAEVLPENLKEGVNALGAINSSGSISFKNQKWSIATIFKSSLGVLDLEGVYNAQLQTPSYVVALKSPSFDIGSFSSISTLETSGFDISLSGSGLDVNNLSANATGELTNLTYRGYKYDDVAIEGKLGLKRFTGKMRVSDSSLDLSLDGDIDFASEVRNFAFTTNINRANFAALGWIPETIEGVFSGSADLALQGNSIDEMIGDFYVQEGKLETPNKTYVFSSIAAQSRLSEKIRVINISSEDVATGLVIGEFKPTELIQLIQNAVGSQYKNYTPHEITPNQYVDFNFNLKGKIAAALFGENVFLDDNTFIKGKINPTNEFFQLSVRAPKAIIRDFILDDLKFNVDTRNPLYHSFASLAKLTGPQGSLLDLNMINSRIKDTLYGRLEFSSMSTPDKLNQLNTSFTFDTNAQAVLEIEDADFYFGGRRWRLDTTTATPTLTATSTRHFSLSKLALKSNTSSFSIEASQYDENSFSLGMDLNELSLREFLSFEDDKWEGVVNGFLNIRQSQNGFGGNSSLHFSDLSLNTVPLGEAYLTLKSESDTQQYQVAFRVEDFGEDVVTAAGTVGIQENKLVWDVNTRFNNYNLSLVSGLTSGVFSPFQGSANGMLNFNSSEKGITHQGLLTVDDFTLGVPYLNTLYYFDKPVSFLFRDDSIVLQNAVFSSKPNQSGTLTGNLTHQSFANWSVDMRIAANNLEVLNTQFSDEALYYGNAYFLGNAHLHGLFSNLQIDVVGQTATGTSLFIPIQYDTAIGDVSFINFIEKERTNDQLNLVNTDLKGLQLNFDLDLTPDAEVEIMVDPEAKSFLRGTGAGNLLLEIDTAGSFAMWGDFIAFDGVYNFKNLGLIDKTFNLRPGGTIVWDGDPYGAQINMEAVYDVPGGANPAILLEGDNVSQKIPTEVSITLFGNLLNPETPTFEIDFPNTSGVIKNELNYKLNDQERRQLQAISLLSQGSFINEVSLEAISSQTLTNNLFQKASGVFDNIFSSDNDKLNLSLDYLQGDRNAAASIKNRDRLGVSLSTNINERILIDGKVGVPVGSEEETTIVGDVKLEFLLNQQGTLRARVFNKENEFQYFGDELGYTQGLGLSYQVRFNSFQELLVKIFNKKTTL